jgi:hypothetical protein
MTERKPDQDLSKGATEENLQNAPGNAGLEGQLGHRDQDAELKDADSDFPEPGGGPEHTGEPQEAARPLRSKIA